MKTEESIMRAVLLAFALCGLCGLVGCIEDPQYIPGPTSIEVGIDDGMGGVVATASVTVDLPVKPESMDDAEERAARATELMVPADLLAYVRNADMEVSIEWSVKNLDAMPGEARIKVNGGNQFFYYVPTEFVIDPEEDEEPPPLMGDIPLPLAASGSLNGVFREDQIHEASVDLEQITRGMINPFAAMLTVNENDPGVTIPPAMLPLGDVAQMVRFEIIFEADRHMVLEYGIRVRDHRNILHEEGLAAPPGEIVTWNPALFVPPPPPP
jgi:hypothetical protein